MDNLWWKELPSWNRRSHLKRSDRHIDNETLGGAMTHNAISGVAHYRTKDDAECIEKIRGIVADLPEKERTRVSVSEPGAVATGFQELYTVLPDDHRAPYDMRAVLSCILDKNPVATAPGSDSMLDEFQADFAKEMICGTARIGEYLSVSLPFAGMSKGNRQPPRLAALFIRNCRKTAYFIEN